MLELWHVIFLFALLSATGTIVQNQKRLQLFKLDKIGVFALLVVLACWLSFYDASHYKAWFNRSLRVTLMFIMYLYFVNTIRDERKMYIFIRGNIIACFISSIILIIEVLRKFNISNLDDFSSSVLFRGTFNNPNQGAGYIVLFTFFLLAFLPQIKYYKIINSRTYLVFTGICFITVLLYRSRIALLALVIVSIILLFNNKKTRRILLISGVLLTLSWNLSLTQFLAARMSSTFGASKSEQLNVKMAMSTIDRFNIANIYWQVIKQKPIFGIGAMNYAYMNKRNDINIKVPLAPTAYYGGSKHYPYDVRNTSAHNMFLSWWVETGTVGLLPFIFSIFFAVKYSFHYMRNHNSNTLFKTLNRAVLGMLLIFIIGGMAHDYGVAEIRYWLLLTLASIILRLSKKHKYDTLFRTDQLTFINQYR